MARKKYLSKEAALKKLEYYCAYQERCHKEVRTKLIDLGIYGDTLEEIIADLITNNYLNEERFAKVYAGGKFRIKKWGRIRIRRELKSRRISEYCIKKGMAEIEDDDYEKTIIRLIEKKNEFLREDNAYILKNKIAKYLVYKGYESALVWKQINKIDWEKEVEKKKKEGENKS